MAAVSSRCHRGLWQWFPLTAAIDGLWQRFCKTAAIGHFQIFFIYFGKKSAFFELNSDLYH